MNKDLIFTVKKVKYQKININKKGEKNGNKFRTL